MGGRDAEFSSNLSKNLKRIVDRLSHIRTMVESDHDDAKARIGEELDEAEAAVRRVRDDADAAGERMRERLPEKKEVIAEWKRKGDVDGLERHAQQTEAYAAWSMIVARAEIEKMSLATMQAIAARLDMDCPTRIRRSRGGEKT